MRTALALLASGLLAICGCSPQGSALKDDAGTDGGLRGDGGERADAGDGGGGSGRSCAELKEAILGWAQAHGTCAVPEDCLKLTAGQAPRDDPAFCGLVAARDGDLTQIVALTDAWSARGCAAGGFQCGESPGGATCEQGRCALDLTDPCSRCDREPVAPVCTVGFQNALNACRAQYCLGDRVADAGVCPDSASCRSAGGTCRITTDLSQPCPDGQRFEFGDSENGCATGDLRDTCCVPWNMPCSFAAGSFNLDHDPFTCEVADRCLFSGPVNGCAFTATGLSIGMGPSFATAFVDAGNAGAIEVIATRTTDGARTRCVGVLSFAAFAPREWHCRSCAGDGGCHECDLKQTLGCHF